MVRLALHHPNSKRLLAWLDSADDAPGITSHIESCDRCANRLEELSAASGDASDDLFGDADIGGQITVAMRDLYVAPEGISERVLNTIDERERVDEEMNLFFGLFAIAKDAAELMLPDDEVDGRGPLPREGTP